ncbi:MAG: type II secretion system inner membrane protein GspF [Parvularculaceae bacterium]|nr:type II secretion system inner membrane protein GspF [Parvularculaceae bacterium]
MPAFEYEAIDGVGRSRRGVVNADNARSARGELRRLKLTPVRLSAPRAERRGEGRRSPRLFASDLELATRQLQALLSARTPVEEALNAVALQTDKARARARLLGVRERVLEGWRLADALAEDPKSFSPVYRAVIAAGEASGDLGGVLERLATMLEKNRSMRDKAVGALIYPTALFLVASSVVVAMMVFVVPKIVEQFNTYGATLPVLTSIVIGVSAFLAQFGLFILAGLALGAAALHQGLKNDAFKLRFDAGLLKLPVVGKLLRGLDGARFARTLSTLFAGGAPLLDSMAGAQRTVSNAYIRSRLETSINMVREGAGLAASLKRAEVLPPMMTHMVAAGERSGAVPQLLDKAAARLEDEFDSSVGVALRLLEPMIIVMMGGAVMTIVLAIMLPILKLNSLAGE